MKNFSILFLILLTALNRSLFSQEVQGVRKDIYDSSFTSQDREDLANLIIEFVTPEIIQMHCDYVNQTNGEQTNIHSDFDFLPFHRLYVERLEDWLLEHGHPEFVPLPYWDPSTPAPQEFRTAGPNENGIDPDCLLTSCGEAPAPEIGCNSISFWEPNHELPIYGNEVTSYLALPIQAGSNNDICDWQYSPTSPDENDEEGLTSKIRSPWHNHVHSFMQGVMSNFRSPSAAIFWIWHAYVDDVWKSWECNCPQSETMPYDLYMKDNAFIMQSERDRGEEPNIDNGPMWVSEDIWVRQSNNGFINHMHENPEYHSSGNPNFVYVQIRNRGCIPSPAGEILELYWAKAATALEWPEYWDGTITIPGVPGVDLSGLVGSISLPSIPAGGSYIAEFEWVVPNPEDYEGLGSNPVFWADQPHHFCLLAKFDSNEDPLVTTTNGIYDFVQDNNNVVWKNLSVIDLNPDDIPPPGGGWDDIKIKPGANVLVGDASGNGGTYDIEFTVPKYTKDRKVTEQAEVRVLLDSLLWTKWVSSGMQGGDPSMIRNETNEIIIKKDTFSIKGLPFSPHERHLVNVRFNFLTKELTGQEYFEYDVIQRESATQKAVGGERFALHIPVRDLFFADAGQDREIFKGESTELNAFEINEEATYKWFDSNGKNLLHTGRIFMVNPDKTEHYKLEVMSLKDGAVDYDEVTVFVKPFRIKSIAPNPVQDNMQIIYDAEEALSASLNIYQPYGNSYGFSLDPQQTTVNINTSTWAPGYYTVLLICDGVAVESKNLIVE